MPELKVQCDCGQKFKFDVEPVNNRMPFVVNCPSCGADGTEKANILLQQAEPVYVLPPPPAPSDVPQGVAPAPATAPPPPPGPPRLRISTAATHAAAPSPDAPPAPIAPPPPAAGAPRRFVPGANMPKPKAVEKPSNLPLGILGAVIGGFLGMMCWFMLIKLTGYVIGYAAVGVGFLAGMGARVLGRAGSPLLGAVAATCAMLAILGGQYLFAADYVNSKLGSLMNMSKLVEGIGGAVYDEQMKHAPEAAKAQTDEEIKALYQKINLEVPSDAELAEFKTNELVELREMASGKLTKDQYIKKLQGKADDSSEKIGFSARWALFKETFSALTILFLLLGISTAYKIGNG